MIIQGSLQDMHGCLLDTQEYSRMPKDSIVGCITYRGRCCCFTCLLLTLMILLSLLPDSTTCSRWRNEHNGDK